MFIETFAPKLTIKAFNKSILNRFTRCYNLSLTLFSTAQRSRALLINSGPKVLPYKILLSSLKIPGHLNSTFALDISNNLRYRVLGWNGKQNVNMIGHQMTFKHLALFLRYFGIHMM